MSKHRAMSKGTILTPRDLLSLKKGEIVWVEHLDNGELKYRGPLYFIDYTPEFGSWTFGFDPDDNGLLLPVYEAEWDAPCKQFSSCGNDISLYRVQT